MPSGRRLAAGFCGARRPLAITAPGRGRTAGTVPGRSVATQAKKRRHAPTASSPKSLFQRQPPPVHHQEGVAEDVIFVGGDGGAPGLGDEASAAAGGDEALAAAAARLVAAMRPERRQRYEWAQAAFGWSAAKALSRGRYLEAGGQPLRRAASRLAFVRALGLPDAPLGLLTVAPESEFLRALGGALARPVGAREFGAFARGWLKSPEGRRWGCRPRR